MFNCCLFVKQKVYRLSSEKKPEPKLFFFFLSSPFIILYPGYRTLLVFVVDSNSFNVGGVSDVYMHDFMYGTVNCHLYLKIFLQSVLPLLTAFLCAADANLNRERHSPNAVNLKSEVGSLAIDCRKTEKSFFRLHLWNKYLKELSNGLRILKSSA